jgi:hypothetical protein
LLQAVRPARPGGMLFIAVVVKLTRAIPPTLQLAGQTV